MPSTHARSTLALLGASLVIVGARTLPQLANSNYAKVSSWAWAASGASVVALLTSKLAPNAVRLTLVRATLSLAISIFEIIDLLLVAAFAVSRAVRQCYRNLVPGASSGGKPNKPSVVIVGGSFAGLRTQRELSDDFDVTLVDLKDYFEYTPGVLRLFTQPHRLRCLAAPLPRARNKVHVGEATAVESGAVRVRTRGAAGAEPVEVELPYDYLVLACGTAYPCAPVKPTAEQPSLSSRQAAWDAAAAELREAPSAIVIGGGLVGVELAAEIAEAFPAKQLTLITSGPTLCSTLSRRVGSGVKGWLEKRGVSVRFNAPVESVDVAAGEVTLRSGAVVSAAVVYDCRGNGEPNGAKLINDEAKEEGDEGDEGEAVDGKGRLVVDETLRSRFGGGNVFAAGDAMALAPCADLKLGHTAELNADVVAENIKHLAAHGGGGGGGGGAEGLATYPHGAVGAAVAPRVFCVSLGEAYGIVSFNGVVVEGSIGAVVKGVLEWTKVAACAERPIGVYFWKFGDAAANFLSRRVLPPPAPPATRPLILFDGVCLLCSTFVHFVLDHDEEEAIDFAALQSDYGKAALLRHGMTSDLSTMVFIDEDGAHVRSTAALRVLSRCGLPYSLIYRAAILLPRPLRDLGYKCVAAVRYRVFGQDDGSSCRRLTKTMRKRFLDH